jgi:diguanylate cyclase (GGDEF)-like protein
MTDLDNFKAINDRDGHLAGDEVLRVFGTQMRCNSRATDIVCRYGGDEFLLVLPGMTKEGAIQRAEQLRGAMATTRVSHGTSQITVTASFGIASYPVHGRTTDELIAAADSALYSAKSDGGNCVSLCSEPRKEVGRQRAHL